MAPPRPSQATKWPFASNLEWTSWSGRQHRPLYGYEGDDRSYE